MNHAVNHGCRWIRRSIAAVGSAALAAGLMGGVLASAGMASAEPEPTPTPGPGRVIHKELPPGVSKVVLRDEIPQQLPGFDLASLPADSPGVFVNDDGSTRPLPAGTAERLPDGKVRVIATRPPNVP